MVKIIKTKDNLFTVITPDKTDAGMELIGMTLTSKEKRGWVRTGGLITIHLQEHTFQIINSLKIGETVEFCNCIK